ALLHGRALVLGGTVGVLAVIHLSEMAKPRKSGKASGGILRTSSDILSGFPSIVLGYVGYAALVLFFHWGFSYLAAVIVLSVMVIPYIAKTTENSLRQVPTGYREGAEALGMSMGYSLRKVVLKTALPGIVTGLLLALAIAGGETAPLIYTGNSRNKHGEGGPPPYPEHVEFKPFGPVENGSQVLYGLDYRMAAWRGEEENPFHTEVGYWMWDARDSEGVRCFLIPRGSAIVAGAVVGADDTKFTLHASGGSQTYGISP